VFVTLAFVFSHKPASSSITYLPASALPQSIIEYLVSEVDEVQEHLDISPFTPDTSRSTRKEGDNKLEDELGDLLMNVLLLTSVAKSQASREYVAHQ